MSEITVIQLDTSDILTYEDCESIGPIDLTEEAKRYISDPDYRSSAAAVIICGHAVLGDGEGAVEPEGLTILYFPAESMAGIAWGGDASWTDADSLEDAIEHWLRDQLSEE